MQQVYQQQLLHQQQQYKQLQAMKNLPEGQAPPPINTLTDEQVSWGVYRVFFKKNFFLKVSSDVAFSKAINYHYSICLMHG